MLFLKLINNSWTKKPIKSEINLSCAWSLIPIENHTCFGYRIQSTRCFHLIPHWISRITHWNKRSDLSPWAFTTSSANLLSELSLTSRHPYFLNQCSMARHFCFCELLSLEYSPLTSWTCLLQFLGYKNGKIRNACTYTQIRILSNTQHLLYSYFRGMRYCLRSNKNKLAIRHRFQTPWNNNSSLPSASCFH